MAFDKAIFTEYDTIVCVDRSGSMGSPLGGSTRWAKAAELTAGIAALAQEVDDDGITLIAFGGKIDTTDGVMADKVMSLFAVGPSGGTPTAEALQAAFDKKMSSSKKAIIFVITDGEPNDQGAVKKVIAEVTKKIPDASHIRIQFVQVGDDPGAQKFLNDLDNSIPGAVFDIVNTVDFTEANNLDALALYNRAVADSH